MSRPGVEILLREEPPARTPPTDTGVWFAVGPAQKGPSDVPSLVRSFSELQTIYGGRVTYSYLWDALDVYFKEGGARAYISRVVGPAALRGSVILKDGGNVNTLQVFANSAGAWGNGLQIDVVAGSTGGTFVIVVSDSTGELERSYDLLDKPAAITWALQSDYIDLVDVVTSALDPAVVADVALTGGTDDNTNIIEANYTTALALFTPDLGPGQVSMPGRTTLAAQTNLLAHASANNRVAIVDLADSGSKSSLKAAAAALQGALPGNRHAGAFAPWAIVPGVVAGTTRTVPYSAVEAGIIARNDGAGLSPNLPAAGIEHGQSVYAIGLSQPKFSPTDRQDLNNSGVCIVREMWGGIVTYGYRTLVDPLQDPNWEMLSNSRLYMAIFAQADLIAENYVFSEIDGKGVTIKKFGGELQAMLMTFFQEGSLYGDTPDQAFIVDTGSTVNTPTTIANLELHAVLMVRMSPFAELVVIEIVKRLVTEAV